MKKITNEYAEDLANKLLTKINELSNEDVSITLENGKSITKDTLVQTILSNGNIYVPIKRTIQFDNLQDETIKNVCNPVGNITMSETFNKGFTVEEFLNTDLCSLDVHCEGINNQGSVVSYGAQNYENLSNSYNNKYYAVTYTGTSVDGANFSADAIYNTIDPTKKDYHIYKVTSATTTKISTEETNILTSSGSKVSSTGYITTKRLKIGNEKYSWNQYTGTIQDSFNNTLYSWKDSIEESSGRIITNAICTYDNEKYKGTPVEFIVNDFSTGSYYKEQNGIIKWATGSLSLVCKYNDNKEIVLDKPTFAKTESASIVSTNLNKIDKSCIGIVSVTTNTITNSVEIIITPNFATLKKPSDISKIVEALQKWNIGLDSTSNSIQGNNIWINTSKGNNSFAEDGTYITNNYVSLSNFVK